MPGNDHHFDLETKKRWGILWWRARCTGCPWSSDWSKDADAVRHQYMAHFEEMLSAASPGASGSSDGEHGSHCQRCNGTGKQPCFNCNGSPGEGIWECTVCQGWGTEKCSICDGQGVRRSRH